MINSNLVNTVFSINGSREGHIVEGAGPDVTGSVLKQYPLVRRGKVSIVKLEGFMINGNYLPFNPAAYAKHR